MIGFGRTLKNIGGRASRPAQKYAKAISTGSNTPRRIVRHSGGGSSAGLNAHRTARLEVNGTGYGNPSLYKNKNKVKSYPNYQSDIMNGYSSFNKTPTHRQSDFRKPKYLMDR